MAKVSFDGGESFLDPLSPFNEFKIKRNISQFRVWCKLVNQMDPELRDQTLTLLHFPSPYLPLLQQRLEFLSAYLIFSPDPPYRHRNSLRPRHPFSSPGRRSSSSTHGQGPLPLWFDPRGMGDRQRARQGTPDSS